MRDMLNWIIGGELILSSAPLIVRDDGNERNKLRRQRKRHDWHVTFCCVFFLREPLEEE